MCVQHGGFQSKDVLFQILLESDVPETITESEVVSLLILLDFNDNTEDDNAAERHEDQTIVAKYRCASDQFFDTNRVS